MRVIALRTLREFWERGVSYAEAKQPLLAWHRHTEKADWATPAELKASVRNASIVGNNRAVFNIGGNKFRLVAAINYPYRVVYVRFVGTHKEYDKINAETI